MAAATGGLIDGPVEVGPGTRLVLMNAVYLKAVWAKKFEEAATKEGDFTLAGGEKTKVPMMHLMGEGLRYYGKGGVFHAIELGYRDCPWSMVVMVPRPGHAVGEVEGWLTAARLEEMVGEMEVEELGLSLPRWKVRCRTDLGPVLKEMGVRRAWESGADFSGVSEGTALCLARVTHEAVVEVDEKGTVAAAGTLVAEGMASDRPRQFVVDRPFVFVVRDRVTGGILFLGRVGDPRGE
jgi:serpin B